MSLDNAQFISELLPTEPPFNDPLGESDDHIRTVKRATQQSFPGVDKEVSTTADELNFVAGVTSGIQSQLDTITANILEAGTSTLFFNATAPTGWTLDTTHNNKALRIVSSAGGGFAGTVGFTTVFSTARGTTSDVHNHDITVNNHTLTVSEIPEHGHPTRVSTSSGGQSDSTGGMMLNTGNASNFAAHSGSVSNTAGQQVGGTGDGAGHDHIGSSDNDTHSHTSNLNVQYVNAIICTKDAF